MQLQSNVAQTRHEQNTSSKRSIRRGLENGLGNVNEDALNNSDVVSKILIIVKPRLHLNHGGAHLS
jgi:hypothetical protein